MSMQDVSSILAGFLASIVEFVEALTIVLAVGVTRGWKPALAGAALAGVSLVVIVALLGPYLAMVPIANVQLVIGALLLLFGFRWLRKAILRSAGKIPIHDEERIFREEVQLLDNGPMNSTASLGHDYFRDPVAVLASFKAVFLEGLEVVFIVIAVGAGARSMWPSAIGAVLAAATVIGFGLVVHRPLSRVPENQLKFTVGLILSAFGIFWIGEGLHVSWPGGDLSIVGLIAYLAILAAVCVRIAARAPRVDSGGAV